MGLNLTLLPLEGNENDGMFSFSVLPLDQDREAFDKIKNIPGYKVMCVLKTYISRDGDKETHYGPTSHDAYGEAIHWCFAGALKDCAIGGPAGAYIDALHNTHKVALFWR